MPNYRLAERYAKSLIDFAIEKNQLEVVFNDMQYIQAVCKISREFVNVLSSPIIKADKKNAIIAAVFAGKISDITAGFTKLLVNKSRENNIVEIANAFIAQYNTIKGIHNIRLTTATAVSDEIKNAIISKVKATGNMKEVQLETATNQSLIGGFVLEYNNNLVDTSIARSLKNIQQQFSQKVYR